METPQPHMLVAKARRWIRKRWLLSKPLFMLHPSELLPGDVILSTERGPVSSTIRGFTKSEFSHAAIVLGEGLYAEAVGFGVRRRSVHTILKDRIKVLRLAEATVADARSIAARAAGGIGPYMSDVYWLQGAMLSIFRNAPIRERQGLFCSHLVAKLYQDAGFDVPPGFEPHKVTPEILGQDKRFEDVSGKAVFHAKAIPEDLLDAGFETFSDRETIILQSMRVELATWFRDNGFRVPETWYAMVVFLLANKRLDNKRRTDLDQKMLAEIVCSGYVALIDEWMHKAVIPMEEYADRIKTTNLSKKEIAVAYYFMEEAVRGLVCQQKEHEENARFYEEQYQKHPLGTLEMLAARETEAAVLTNRMWGANVKALNALWDKLSPSDQAALRAANPSPADEGPSPPS